jgi:transposase
MCQQIEVMLGDALYSNREVCSIDEGYRIRPYFHPKTNATFCAKGVESWKNMLYSFVDNTQEWLAKYYMRSISEASFNDDEEEDACKDKEKASSEKEGVRDTENHHA